MFKTANDIRALMQAGKATIGTWMQLASPDAAEILANAGYDWIAVDLEHGAFSRCQLPDLFRAIESGGAAPFARIAESTKTLIKGALDSGARGIILPMIERAEQLEEAMTNIFYPEGGERGVGYCRANLFGKNFNSYLQGAAKDIIVVAQIEHVRALNEIDAILSHPKLDAIMVGPYDLSGSLGRAGDFANPEFEKTMGLLHEAAKRHNVPMGAHVVQPNSAELKKRVDEGYTFLAYGIDSVFLYHAAQRPQG